MYKGLLRRCKIMIVSSVAFIVLIGLSMMLYPGGNIVDRTSVHYNFFLNFFSDLGSTFTPSGKQNTASDVLFLIAMGMFGLIMIYYSRIWRGIYIEVHELTTIGILSKISLIVSGLCFIGMAFSPWNLHFENHVILFKCAMLGYLIWTLLILVLQQKNEKIRSLFILNAFLLFVLGIYVYTLLSSDDFGTARNIEFHAFSQKVVFLLISLNLLIQSVGLLGFLRRADFRRSGMKNFYV